VRVGSARPNDARRFFHRRVLGLIGDVAGIVSDVVGLPGAGVVSGIAGRLAGGNGGNGAGVPCPPGHNRIAATGICVPSQFLNVVCPAGHDLDATGKCVASHLLRIISGPNGGNGTACEPPLVDRGRGFCEFIGGPSGGAGEVTVGRYGPAQEPTFRTVNVRDCNPGQILAKDFLCYNKGAISNKERLYPRGTQPLLTGGQMAAIRTASAAETRVRTAAVRLGIVAKAPRKKSTPSGHKAKLVHT